MSVRCMVVMPGSGGLDSQLALSLHSGARDAGIELGREVEVGLWE